MKRTIQTLVLITIFFSACGGGSGDGGVSGDDSSSSESSTETLIISEWTIGGVYDGPDYNRTTSSEATFTCASGQTSHAYVDVTCSAATDDTRFLLCDDGELVDEDSGGFGTSSVTFYCDESGLTNSASGSASSSASDDDEDYSSDDYSDDVYCEYYAGCYYCSDGSYISCNQLDW